MPKPILPHCSSNARQYDESPLYEIYEQSLPCAGGRFRIRAGSTPTTSSWGLSAPQSYHLNEVQVRGVRNVAERIDGRPVLLLENSMGLLATAVTTAPFLGLLGTVWGVMESFGGMAVTGSAMLSAVAPGISGALLTTVVGLLVALPSAIGYNV